MTKYD
jgi:hypothetical protein